MVEKRFTKEGKKMFNVLVNTFGKKKARSIFYTLEKKKPEMVKNWRE